MNESLEVSSQQLLNYTVFMVVPCGIAYTMYRNGRKSEDEMRTTLVRANR